MPIELRGDKKPRPQLGKTHKSTRLVRFVDLNDLIKDINTQIQEIVDSIGEGGGNFIPLSGTEENAPVTGNIEIELNNLYNGIKSIVDEEENERIVGISDDGFPVMYCEFNERNSTSRVSCETDGVQLLSEGDENTTYFGIKSNIDATEVEPENDLIYAQRAYVNRAVSYSTDETVTGGTWIDGKPIYTIVKLTLEADPANIETRFPDIIVGLRSVLRYTKTTD